MFQMDKTVIVFFVSFIISVLAFKNPSQIPRHLQPDASAHLLQNLNYGYQDEVMQEHWGRAILPGNSPPTLYASTLDVTLIGKEMISYGQNNVTNNCFQGLRFAKKSERFKPPEMLEKPYYTESTYVADHLPDKCAQHALFTPNIAAGTEDCLYLSVYTPLIKEANETFADLYPVMIFFHGGAFIWGDSSLYLPTRLLDQKVLLVVPHYRLGSFGFFSTMNENAPGNIGLYDQQMSMKWVQEHIESFGGDKSRVTIFGQSAGSASVNYHLIIESSRGLMHNIIGESGSALEHWSLDEDPKTSAYEVAQVNGCNIQNRTDMDEIYNCMAGLDADVIALGINTLSHNDRLIGLMGFRGAAPILQNENMDLSPWGAEILITEPPADCFKGDQLNSDVNLMIGANKHEGSFVFGIMYSSYIFPNNLTFNETYLHERMIPDLLHSFGIDDSTHSLSESLAELYLEDADRTNFDSCTPGMIDLSGVLFQKAGTMETAKLHSNYKSNGTNTYLYAFEFESEDTTFNWLFMGHVDEFPEAFKPGVTHSDELLYLFSWPAVMNGTQLLIRDRMVKLWTNFAIYGDPTPLLNPDWKELGLEKWENYDENEYYYLMEEEFHLEQRYSERWTISNQEARGNIVGTTTPIIETTPNPTTETTTPLTGSTSNPVIDTIAPWTGSTSNGSTSNPIDTATPSTVSTSNPMIDTTTSPECPTHSDKEFEDLQKERDAYMATMIVFIISFAIADAVIIYLLIKK